MLILTGMLVYFVSFVAIRQLYPQGILFYQGLALSFLVPLAQGIIIYLRTRTHPVPQLKDLSITLLLAYAFVVTFPTQAERSFSLRLLQHIEAAPQGLTREEIGQLLYRRDFVERGGLDKRLIEQQASGTVRKQAGRYTLKARGRATNAVSRLMCKAFACQAQATSEREDSNLAIAIVLKE